MVWFATLYSTVVGGSNGQTFSSFRLASWAGHLSADHRQDVGIQTPLCDLIPWLQP